MHWLSAEHVVPHAAPLHRNWPQEVCAPATHVPEPLQSEAAVSVCVPSLHDAAEHTVPETYFRHAPMPSHMPSLPQLGAPASVHSLPGSVPPLIGPQVPSAPCPLMAAVHALHVPEQEVLQQTPSATKPLVHSFAPPAELPLDFFATHEPPEQ